MVQNEIIGHENTLVRLTIDHGFGPREIVIMRRNCHPDAHASTQPPERASQSAGVGLILDTPILPFPLRAHRANFAPTSFFANSSLP